MTKISVSIMMHPKRKEHLPYLKEKLGDVPVAMDRINNIWDTAKRAWQLYDPEADYHIVVQDDILIGKDFLTHASLMMTNDVIYNFYMSKRPRFKREVERCKRDGIPFLKKTNLHHECCFGMRSERIDDMIAYCETQNPDSDRVINKYIQKEGLEVWFPMPSLVSHRVNDSLHSLNRGRYPIGARWWIGE